MDKEFYLFYVCSMPGLNIVWFREDLRVHDHAALRAACQAAARDNGQVMALYIGPAGLNLDDQEASDEAQFLFEALADLRAALAQRNASLHLRCGEVLDVLSDLHRQHQVLSIDLHESLVPQPIEASLEAWCMRAGTRFRRHRQFQPDLSPRSHESWQMVWERFMARPRHEAPDEINAANVGVGPWPALEWETPKGGRKCAIQTLRLVLAGQGAGANSLPSGRAAFEALLPHMRLGVVSLREIWQAAIGAHQQALKSGLDIRAASLASFLNLIPTMVESRTDHPGQFRRVGHSNDADGPAKRGHQFSLGFGDFPH